jgi:hypothetical protein
MLELILSLRFGAGPGLEPETLPWRQVGWLEVGMGSRLGGVGLGGTGSLTSWVVFCKTWLLLDRNTIN